MKKQLLTLVSLSFLLTGMLFGCSENETASNAPVETQSNTQATSNKGKLQIRANGEDFVREGFLSKDGWQISFDHVYTNLADVTAYQSDPPFNAIADSSIQAKEKVVIDEVKTVDLAEGDESAEPILVAEVTEVPSGQYNALSWKMVRADAGPFEDQVLVMEGKAEKEGQTVDFVIKIDQELEFICGEFVGDQRKGILPKDGTTDLEATFHFDHLFGDADTPADDALNMGALGFQPLANLAEAGKLEVDQTQLKSELSAEDYKKLQELLPSLGHVGEGHCRETKLDV
ncbi:MAG: DUF4382 domain-containing protein [Coleofasciculaceae cyanobacterium]